MLKRKTTDGNFKTIKPGVLLVLNRTGGIVAQWTPATENAVSTHAANGDSEGETSEKNDIGRAVGDAEAVAWATVDPQLMSIGCKILDGQRPPRLFNHAGSLDDRVDADGADALAGAFFPL